VRMPRLGREDQQVCHIHHADAQGGAQGAQERGSREDLKGQFDADADEDDVRVGVCGAVGGEAEDGGAGGAVGRGFGRGEVDGRGLFAADYEVGVVA
jgi:hypothetical protein